MKIPILSSFDIHWFSLLSIKKKDLVHVVVGFNFQEINVINKIHVLHDHST